MKELKIDIGVDQVKFKEISSRSLQRFDLLFNLASTESKCNFSYFFFVFSSSFVLSLIFNSLSLSFSFSFWFSFFLDFSFFSVYFFRSLLSRFSLSFVIVVSKLAATAPWVPFVCSMLNVDDQSELTTAVSIVYSRPNADQQGKYFV